MDLVLAELAGMTAPGPIRLFAAALRFVSFRRTTGLSADARAGPLTTLIRHSAPAELAELVSESWVLPPPESVIGSVVMEAFRASGLDYSRTTVVTESPEVRTSLLATGRFVTIFPASALRFPTRRSEIKVLPVELPSARLPNGIVTLKNRTLSPVAQLVIDCAREVAKPIAKRK